VAPPRERQRRVDTLFAPFGQAAFAQHSLHETNKQNLVITITLLIWCIVIIIIIVIITISQVAESMLSLRPSASRRSRSSPLKTGDTYYYDYDDFIKMSYPQFFLNATQKMG